MVEKLRGIKKILCFAMTLLFRDFTFQQAHSSYEIAIFHFSN